MKVPDSGRGRGQAYLPLVGPAAVEGVAAKTQNLPGKEKPKTIPARGAVEPPVGRPCDGGTRIDIQRKETRISDTGSPGSFLDEKMLLQNCPIQDEPETRFRFQWTMSLK